MREFYSIPKDLMQKYPDAGVYEFWQGDKVAPLVVTKDPSTMRLGALVVYQVVDSFSCGFVVDKRGDFYILDNAISGELAEVPRRDLIGVSVGLVTRNGIVTNILE